MTDRDGGWLGRLWPIACAIGVALLAARRLHDGDLFWHLALGRAVVESGRLTVPEPLTIPDFESTSLAHSWVWEVLLYGVWKRFGWTGVSWLVVAVAGLAGAALGALVTRWDRERPPRAPVAILVTALAVPLVVTRLNERPECVTLALWPLALLLARGLAGAATVREGLPRAAALVAIGFLWAQLHLSVFAYAAAVGLLLARGALGGAPVSRLLAATIALVALATFTTPHGPGLVFILIRHPVGTYIAEHVPEWMPLRWDMLDPFDRDNLQGPAYVLLAVMPLLGAWRIRRRAAVEIALVFLGLALVTQGRRSVTPAAILSIPLAIVVLDRAIGRSASWAARGLRVVAVAIGVFALGRTVSWLEEHDGSLLRLGLEDGAFPTAAARLFEGSSTPRRALTTYRTGPTIAFATRGVVRDFVDSRTPLGFTEANLAAARATWSDPRALEAAVRRWGFDVAVVERASPVCEALHADKGWLPVLVEPAFATFVRGDGSPLERLAPCGTTYLDARSCAAPLDRLDAEIERVARLVPAPFADHLRAERMLRCTPLGGHFDGDAIQALIPRPEDASGFEAARDALEAWLLALARRAPAAAALLAPRVARGQAWVLADSLPSLARGGADVELRSMLEKILAADENTPANDTLVVTLANVCARLRDVGCASIHASHAALLGRADAAPALCFVKTDGESHETRADADRWLSLLGASCR